MFYRKIILSVVVAVLFIIMFPMQFSESIHLEIKATGQKNESSKGSEVWLRELKDDNRLVPASDISLGGWEIEREMPVSYRNQPSIMTWEGKANQLTISLASHPYSGYVDITINGKTRTYDLYNSSDSFKTLQFSIPLSATSVLKYMLIGIALTILCYVLLIKGPILKKILSKSSIVYFSLPFVVWCTYWLAFYPGLMSGDSIDQWRQIQTLELYDAHPVFHTLTNWLLTRVWNSPAILSLSQITFFSIVLSKSLILLEKDFKVKQTVTFILCLFFSLLPVHGMLVNTIWKDIPYSVTLLLLTYILMKIYITKGSWLESRKHQISLIIIILITALFRHNGIIPAFGTCIALFIYYKPQWRHILKISLSAVLLFLFIKVFLYSFLNIAPTPKVLSLSIPIHQVGAVIHSGATLSDKEARVINQLMPVENWAENYQAYTVDTLIYNPKFDIHIFDERPLTGEFLKVWFSLALKHPVVVIKDWAYMTSIIWEMKEPLNSRNYYVETDIVKTGSEILDRYQLHSMSKLPSLKNTLLKIVNTSLDVNLSWILYRPAVYFFALLLALYLLLKKYSFRITILTLPLLLNTASLVIAIPAQQLRYVYSALIIIPIIIALLFRRNIDSKEIV